MTDQQITGSTKTQANGISKFHVHRVLEEQDLHFHFLSNDGEVLLGRISGTNGTLYRKSKGSISPISNVRNCLGISSHGYMLLEGPKDCYYVARGREMPRTLHCPPNSRAYPIAMSEDGAIAGYVKWKERNYLMTWNIDTPTAISLNTPSRNADAPKIDLCLGDLIEGELKGVSSRNLAFGFRVDSNSNQRPIVLEGREVKYLKTPDSSTGKALCADANGVVGGSLEIGGDEIPCIWKNGDCRTISISERATSPGRVVGITVDGTCIVETGVERDRDYYFVKGDTCIAMEDAFVDSQWKITRIRHVCRTGYVLCDANNRNYSGNSAQLVISPFAPRRPTKEL